MNFRNKFPNERFGHHFSVQKRGDRKFEAGFGRGFTFRKKEGFLGLGLKIIVVKTKKSYHSLTFIPRVLGL